MMELVWTPEAMQDRDDIYEYIELENPLAALTLDELFSEKAAQLVGHPNSGRPGRVPGSRELVAHPSYMLVYDVVGMQVRVLSVVHTARQWPPSLG
ncbi:type II toxin-antitoxin system RelE/ParE family toxin [Salinicola avicenniae]|uniref:type II toxin-antitoxin system RelE/ParE family toxin n=1 Tax=Salinicola avicenniae TaxID=2916836 RepID=UPI002072C885|nr:MULTISPECIES: type II toxin-antitoxin system RelE/ParE family toxin [unclassified Salinicola]